MTWLLEYWILLGVFLILRTVYPRMEVKVTAENQQRTRSQRNQRKTKATMKELRFLITKFSLSPFINEILFFFYTFSFYIFIMLFLSYYINIIVHSDIFFLCYYLSLFFKKNCLLSIFFFFLQNYLFFSFIY